MIICENIFEHNISLNIDNTNITRVSDFNILLGLMINHNLEGNKKCSRPIGILNKFYQKCITIEHFTLGQCPQLILVFSHYVLYANVYRPLPPSLTTPFCLLSFGRIGHIPSHLLVVGPTRLSDEASGSGPFPCISMHSSVLWSLQALFAMCFHKLTKSSHGNISYNLHYFRSLLNLITACMVFHTNPMYTTKHYNTSLI